MIQARLIHDTILSSSQEAFSLYEKSCWGEKRADQIEYTTIEALTLMHEKKMRVYNSTKALLEDELMKKLIKKDKRFKTKQTVFEDLRKKGYIVKTALKFGAEFRVYEKGVKPGQDHAAWLVYPLKESEATTWYDFAAKNRVASSTKKKLMLAIVDDELDVTYYEVTWFKP